MKDRKPVTTDKRSVEPLCALVGDTVLDRATFYLRERVGDDPDNAGDLCAALAVLFYGSCVAVHADPIALLVTIRDAEARRRSAS